MAGETVTEVRLAGAPGRVGARYPWQEGGEGRPGLQILGLEPFHDRWAAVGCGVGAVPQNVEEGEEVDHEDDEDGLRDGPDPAPSPVHHRCRFLFLPAS